MKVIIKHYAPGVELVIGSVSQETWDYLQNVRKGDVTGFLADLICVDHVDDNGGYDDYYDDHDDYDMTEACLKYCNDDLFHKTAGWLDAGCVEITNDKGKTIYECTWDSVADFYQSGIQFDLAHESIDWFVRYISIGAAQKGVILTGEFDIEGEYDPAKLKVLCTVVYCNGKHTHAMVTGFEYNGKRIDCSIESARGRQMDFKVIESKNYVGNY